jgi:cytochrome bd-type quinol oxidase subunit 2
VLTMPSPLNRGSLFRPSVVFSILLVLALLLQLARKPWSTRTLKIFDTALFLLLGLAGILLLFMWFGTDHRVTQNNYNLLWALPTHVAVAFVLYRGKTWVSTYFTVVFWLTAALLALWAFLPQEMNNALLPLIMLILLRSWQLSKRNHHGKKTTHL